MEYPRNGIGSVKKKAETLDGQVQTRSPMTLMKLVISKRIERQVTNQSTIMIHNWKMQMPKQRGT